MQCFILFDTQCLQDVVYYFFPMHSKYLGEYLFLVPQGYRGGEWAFLISR